MKRASQQNDRWKPGLIGAALTGFAGALLALTVLGDGLADLSYDLLFRFRPTLKPDGVALVYMDEPSAKQLGQPWKSAAWDRALHARLIQRLVDFQARAVVFDVLFDLPATNDPAFLQAVTAAPRAGVPVIVGAKFERSARVQTYERIGRLMVPPFDELRAVAAWGMVVSEESRERTIRQLVADQPGLPSLASRVAESVFHRSFTTAAPRWINYYGPPGTLPSASYSEALQTNFAHAAQFSNQVVFVGEMTDVLYQGGGETDDWPTPFTRWKHGKSTGTEINATAYLNVARRDWLRRLPDWAEAVIALVMGTLLGFGLACCQPVGATAVSGLAVGLAGAASLWAMWQAHVWFPWLIVAGVQVPLALGWAILAHARRLHREKELLAAKVAALEPMVEIAGAAILQADTPRRRAAEVASGPANAEKGMAAAPVAGFVSASGGSRTRLVADHTLLRCVGQGAYGEVWLARNAVGLLHAVKLVHRGRFSSQEPFEREFRGIQRFMPVSRQHPGLVQILHVGRDDAAGCIYYVMEPGDDETTGQQIQPETYSPKNLAKEIKRRGRLPGAECVELGLALGAALEFLHSQQLIHRDIKPSNIIFVRAQPKFTDISLVTEVATTKSDVSYLGTQGYIAPEGPGRPPADLFSLGRVLYEAWTGLTCERYPELPAEVRQWPDRDLVLALNKIIIKACHPDLTQRYASAALLGKELLRLRK